MWALGTHNGFTSSGVIQIISLQSSRPQIEWCTWSVAHQQWHITHICGPYAGFVLGSSVSGRLGLWGGWGYGWGRHQRSWENMSELKGARSGASGANGGLGHGVSTRWCWSNEDFPVKFMWCEMLDSLRDVTRARANLWSMCCGALGKSNSAQIRRIQRLDTMTKLRFGLQVKLRLSAVLSHTRICPDSCRSARRRFSLGSISSYHQFEQTPWLTSHNPRWRSFLVQLCVQQSLPSQRVSWRWNPPLLAQPLHSRSQKYWDRI